MLFFFQLWIFNIDLTVLLSFIVGIGIGMVILCLIYALLVVLSMKDKHYQVKLQANDLSAQESKEMIEIARSAFKSKDLRGDMTKNSHFIQVGKDLVYGIASRFYPDSKYPLAELTIDECLELITYVQGELSKLLDNKILRIAKRLKVSDILKLTQATTAVVDSKTFEVTKEVTKAVNIGRKVINLINPVWWGKKIISDVAIGLIMDKLYLAVLTIIGEEAYKIYSKSYKNSYEETESSVGEVLEGLNKELKDEFRKENPDIFKNENKMDNDNGGNDFPMKGRTVLPSSSHDTIKEAFDENERLKVKKSGALELPLNDVKELAAPEE